MRADAFVAHNSNSSGGIEDGDTRGDGAGPVRFRTAKNDVTAVNEKQSECFLLPVDLWKRGMGRIQVVPRARCAVLPIRIA